LVATSGPPTVEVSAKVVPPRAVLDVPVAAVPVR
jgi:hypothetical protein